MIWVAYFLIYGCKPFSFNPIWYSNLAFSTRYAPLCEKVKFESKWPALSPFKYGFFRVRFLWVWYSLKLKAYLQENPLLIRLSQDQIYELYFFHNIAILSRMSKFRHLWLTRWVRVFRGSSMITNKNPYTHGATLVPNFLIVVSSIF